MRINVCICGTFRYLRYIQYYQEFSGLEKFFYSGRIAAAESMGLPPEKAKNLWFKQYALNLGLRLLPAGHGEKLALPLADIWQRSVIRNWVECDTVEAVIGQIADRVLLHAKKSGAKTMGHPVNSHPARFAELLNAEYDDLGLDCPRHTVTARHHEEIALCDHFLVDSKFVAESYIENGISRDRVSVVCPGADLVRFTPRDPASVDTNTFRVISVGGIVPRKGHRYLLEAWNNLKLPNSELIIVGALGVDSQKIFGPYTGTFRHIPNIPNNKLGELLETATVFVMPSVEDGFGQAAVEALCCGVPAIVTSATGAADVINDGVNGFIVPPRSTKALEEKLLELYENRDKAISMGIAAANIATTSFDWRPYVQEVLGLHQSLLNCVTP